mmetsp:Transcript_29342/g.39872  ORF Transcript_29342/g.39872 Transcript_29342/m.39872 type:complete len:607 (-) Transcript_29342:591-2411(-)
MVVVVVVDYYMVERSPLLIVILFVLLLVLLLLLLLFLLLLLLLLFLLFLLLLLLLLLLFPFFSVEAVKIEDLRRRIRYGRAMDEQLRRRHVPLLSGPPGEPDADRPCLLPLQGRLRPRVQREGRVVHGERQQLRLRENVPDRQLLRIPRFHFERAPGLRPPARPSEGTPVLPAGAAAGGRVGDHQRVLHGADPLGLEADFDGEGLPEPIRGRRDGQLRGDLEELGARHLAREGRWFPVEDGEGEGLVLEAPQRGLEAEGRGRGRGEGEEGQVVFVHPELLGPEHELRLGRGFGGGGHDQGSVLDLEAALRMALDVPEFYEVHVRVVALPPVLRKGHRGPAGQGVVDRDETPRGLPHRALDIERVDGVGLRDNDLDKVPEVLPRLRVAEGDRRRVVALRVRVELDHVVAGPEGREVDGRDPLQGRRRRGGARVAEGDVHGKPLGLREPVAHGENDGEARLGRGGDLGGGLGLRGVTLPVEGVEQRRAVWEGEEEGALEQLGFRCHHVRGGIVLLRLFAFLLPRRFLLVLLLLVLTTTTVCPVGTPLVVVFVVGVGHREGEVLDVKGGRRVRLDAEAVVTLPVLTLQHGLQEPVRRGGVLHGHLLDTP